MDGQVEYLLRHRVAEKMDERGAAKRGQHGVGRGGSGRESWGWRSA
eukprot:gene11103-13544_t